MCDCIEKMDKRLNEDGERLSLVILLDGSPTRPAIKTEKISGKGRIKINVIAKHCPFCGEKYS